MALWRDYAVNEAIILLFFRSIFDFNPDAIYSKKKQISKFSRFFVFLFQILGWFLRFSHSPPPNPRLPTGPLLLNSIFIMTLYLVSNAIPKKHSRYIIYRKKQSLIKKEKHFFICHFPQQLPMNVTNKCVYLAIWKLHSILVVANYFPIVSL